MDSVPTEPPGKPRGNTKKHKMLLKDREDVPGGTVDGNPLAYTGDTSRIPGPGRFYTPRATKPECHTTAEPKDRELQLSRVAPTPGT